MRALAEVLLERYGIVTRETVLAEGVPGGFAALYGELGEPGDARHRPPRLLRGGPRRRPVRARRRRSSGCAACATDEAAGALVLAATDPANPYGASLPWPKRDDDSERAVRPACPAPTW